MKLWWLFPLLLCGAAAAQDTRGYFFVAPGGITGYGHTSREYYAGGGLETKIYRWVGAGAELQAALPPRAFSSGACGMFSVNGYARPLEGKRRLDPFFTMGYTLAFRTDTANLFNYGGGMDYWFRERIGLRLEIRDHTHNSLHYWGVRFGLSFR